MNRPHDRLHFAFAGPADDAELRRLLRATPMRGAIRVGFAHEPDYFRGTAVAGAEDRMLLAREDGRLVAAGRCVIQPRWLNGEVRRCAYLGELRLDPAVQSRWDILRRGYAFFATEYARAPADCCFTSIISDNRRARRLLERGVRGLPHYEPLAGFHTLLLRTQADDQPRVPAGFEWVTGDAVPAGQLAEFLNGCGRERNLAVYWTAERLTSLAAHGLHPADFLVLRRGSMLAGCAAVWDQRAFRQVIVHGYSPWLAALRPLANLAGTLGRWPHLPPPGATLAQAYLSPLTVAPEFAHLLPALIKAGLSAAARRGLDCLALGFPAADPHWPAVARAFRGRLYTSQLYTVRWPGTPAPCPAGTRPCRPELALL